jgi:PAS domain-containing protein
MDFVHPDDKDTVLGWHHKEGGEFSGEYRILKPDGTVWWISASLFHVKEESIHDEKPRRILEKARERRVLHEGRESRFTFSCGISDSRSCEAGKCTLEGLGNEADERLY